MSCNILSFQAENIALFPEEYVNNKLLTSRRTYTRKHGSLWEFYRYVTDKKGFGNIDETEEADLSLVENFNILDNDLEIND